MVETRLPDEILHEIEEDLRQDQDLWKHIHTDLHALGAPSARARPRTRWIVLGAVASVIALFAAFAVGWQTAPGTTEEVAVTRIVTVAPLPGIAEEKYEALAGSTGSRWSRPCPRPRPRRGSPRRSTSRSPRCTGSHRSRRSRSKSSRLSGSAWPGTRRRPRRSRASPSP